MADPPAVFFENFVRRAYDEFLRNPCSEYHAKTAVMHANIMAERVWHWLRAKDPSKIFNATSAGAYRRGLVQNANPDFQLVWDVADGFKHFTLSRPGRRITSAHQTSVQGGGFDKAVFEETAFDNEPRIVITLDDQTERSLSDVLASVMRMWELIVKRDL